MYYRPRYRYPAGQRPGRSDYFDEDQNAVATRVGRYQGYPAKAEQPVRPGQTVELEEERPPAQPESAPVQPEPAPEPVSETDWQAVAARLQADMENFRKRQIRQANEAAQTERERLLRQILPIADNLERALNQGGQAETPLRQGIELTYRELMRMLEREGVSRIESLGQPFDPNWHEALASVPNQATPNTIIQEVEAGYTVGDKLLRPARVVVAA
jgi:molecular chaperone GrpE